MSNGKGFAIANIYKLINLLMCEQVDAPLQLPISYHFQRDKLANYRTNSINSQNFFEWTRNDMYRSSYAHHHSPVRFLLPRTRLSHVRTTFLAIRASSPRTELKVCMPRPSPIRPNKSSIAPVSTSIAQVWPLLASTLPKMPLSTNLSLLRVTSMASQKSKNLILVGS
jgi:hypothetical protein